MNDRPTVPRFSKFAESDEEAIMLFRRINGVHCSVRRYGRSQLLFEGCGSTSGKTRGS